MPKRQELPEPERFVKKYELDAAVVAIINEWKETTDKKFEEIKNQLEVGFKGLATMKYVSDKIDEFRKEVDLTYGGQSKGIDKFKWIIISGLIGIGMQVVTFCILYGGIRK